MSQREQSCGCQGRGEGRTGVSEVSGCKLLHIEWVKDKILLCGTGNYIRYPGINQSGRECNINNKKYFKKNVYMCIIESLCYTAKINITL